MEFLKTIKLNGLKELLKAKDRDEVRGRIEAEKDLEGVLMQITKFDDLVAYMETRYVPDAETVLFERLLKEKDPIEEKRMIAQLAHTIRLQKKFMKYVRSKT